MLAARGLCGSLRLCSTEVSFMVSTAGTMLEVDRLRVRDEAFLVASMIERCPKVMMLRELVQNAIEAASLERDEFASAHPSRSRPWFERVIQTSGGSAFGHHALAPAADRRVEIGSVMIDGVRKLAIWNTGPGMDAEELHRMCDLASSIGKQHGLDRNFGMGAKVASLPSNQHGILYRSCKQGRVHELLLGKRDGVYGRVRRAGVVSGAVGEVFDVTARAAADARPLDFDWTEVVLLGLRADQDTVGDPYGGDPEVAAWWIAEGLHDRFFRLPEGIALWLGPDVHPRPGRHRFMPITERIRTSFDRHEAVRSRDGILVHYFYDGPDPERPGQTRASRDALQPATSVCALVFKDEVYGLHRGWGWWHMAPAFGIPFAQRHISIFIELPDNETVRQDAYRQFLRYRHGIQDQVFIRHFSTLVAEYRPRWVIDLVREHAPDHAHAEVVREELGRLLKSLRIRRRYRPREESTVGSGAGFDNDSVEDESGDPKSLTDNEAAAEEAAAEMGGLDKRSSEAADAPNETEHGSDETKAVAVAEAVEQPALEEEDYEPAPQLMALREPDEVAAKGLNGRAARYYPESHQLFVNLLYPAVEQMREALEASFTGKHDSGEISELAREQSEQTLMRRVGRALVYALAKREGVAFWQAWDVDRAMAPESLSVAADDFSVSFDAARAAMEARLHETEREREAA
jgi:hypothetical protein